MSKFTDLQKAIEAGKCPKCHGLGHIDDAEPGDIYYNTFPCRACHGQGIVTDNGWELHAMEIISQVFSNSLKRALQRGQDRRKDGGKS